MVESIDTYNAKFAGKCICSSKCFDAVRQAMKIYRELQEAIRDFNDAHLEATEWAPGTQPQKDGAQREVVKSALINHLKPQLIQAEANQQAACKGQL